MATRSRGGERDVLEVGRGLALLEALGQYAQRECLRRRYGQVTGGTVGQRAGQLDHLGDPAAIVLLLDFDGELHTLSMARDAGSDPVRKEKSPGNPGFSPLW